MAVGSETHLGWGKERGKKVESKELGGRWEPASDGWGHLVGELINRNLTRWSWEARRGRSDCTYQ